MGRPRKSHDRVGGDDILSALSAARQKEILEEALGAQAREIFAHHRGGTFGALFDALQRNRHWSFLQKLSVSTVLSGAGRAAGGGKGKPGRPRGSKTSFNPALLDKLVSVIQKHPGKRSEELQRLVSGNRHKVKAALARLREQKRVKTSGAKRATTYTAVV